MWEHDLDRVDLDRVDLDRVDLDRVDLDRVRACERGAGSDAHQRTVVVGRLTRETPGARLAETQTCGTTTGDLPRFADWLTEGGCPPVGPARTGAYRTPVFHLLEGTCAVWLRNP